MPAPVPLPKAPAFKLEHSGSAIVDRIQSGIQDIITFLRALLAAQPTCIVLGGEFSTTGVALVSTLLAIPVKKGEIWDVEFFGRGACSSVNGMVYAIGAPPGSTVSGVLYSSSANVGVVNWILTAIDSIDTASAALHVGASNSFRPDHLNARVEVGNSDGFITIKAGAITAGTIARVARLSVLRGRRINERTS